MDTTLFVSDAKSIRALAGALSFWRMNRRVLSVELPGLDDTQNKDLKRRIAVHQGACGCGSGRLSGIATMTAIALLLVTGVLSFRALGWWRILGLYFLVSFLAMFVSKVISLHLARRALRSLADEVDRVSGSNRPIEEVQ